MNICVPIGQPCSPALSSAPANCNLANPSRTKLFSQHFIFWQFSTNMFTFAILLRVSPPTCFPFFSTFLKYFRPVLNTQTHFDHFGKWHFYIYRRIFESLILFSIYWTRVRSLVMLVTNSLTNSRLVNLIDVTLACEDANSKLVEVVTVDDVDAEDHVGNSLLQIWKLTFGPKAKLLVRLWTQGLVKILKLKFRQYFEAGVCASFCRWCLVEFMRLNLGRYSKARFGQYFEF